MRREERSTRVWTWEIVGRLGAAAALLALLSVAAGAQPPAGPPPAQTAVLSRTSVPAVGRQEAILTTTGFGRVAITATSQQGTALQLVDRMAGPGEVNGVAGESNGRLDLFLDRGAYKVVALSHEKGRGDATLAARTFAERNAPPPLLVELKPVEGDLDDFQQLSYWLEVGERRHVAIEAAGRSLADLRLWESGTWLVDASPVREVVQPRPGKPLAVFRLATELNPGLYLLTAYGGPAQPWAEDDGRHPFRLRFGIPTLGVAGRQRYTVSEFGIDRYLVPSQATFFRVELPEARGAVLQVGQYDEGEPFRPAEESAEISKKSVPPVAELETGGANFPFREVTVGGGAGQPYVLQHFERRDVVEFKESGNYWLSTVHSGAPADSVDATAIVTRSLDVGERHQEVFAAQAVELDALHGWARRCNLLDTLTVFLHVGTAGTYEVLSRGTTAHARIEPFLTFRPEHYEAPEFRPSPSSWELDSGYYVLTVEPVKKGILDIVVRPKGLLELALDAIGKERKFVAGPVRAAVAFPLLALDTDHDYTLYLNDQPGVAAGAVLRALPLDLGDPLPLTQRPGDKVNVPFTVSEPGVLAARAEDGSLLDVAVDGANWAKTVDVAPGTHTVEVRNTGKDTAVYSLSLVPRRLESTTPLPPMPDATLAALPSFPVLTDKQPVFLDLARDEARSFLVSAGEPALYRLESTGLLETHGNLRTRTITSLDAEHANGVGRNFFIEQYLREGGYQLTLSPSGRSAGHLGVVLERTPLRDGGSLREGVPARISLAAGEGVVYRFHVERPGDFRLQGFGLNRTFRCRLEDGDGWPILAPNVTAAIARRFEPGDYRLVILPEPVATRSLTLLERVPEPLRFAGHGPNPLPLGREVEHVWFEPEKGGERAPDLWDLDVPADVDAAVSLTGEMQADLLRGKPDGSYEKSAFVPPGRGWTGTLAAGRWRIAAVCSRVNNRVSYRLNVQPQQLVAGLHREVEAPASVALAVGRPGLVELSSFGNLDVKARLYDAAGRLVAANDDRPDDWNFEIAEPLTPGRYRLQVDPVGSANASCTVAMDQPPEALEAAAALPASLELAAGDATHVLPLILPAGADLLVAGADAEESVACSVETADGRALAMAVGRRARLELPLPENAAAGLRLRVWSVDRRGGAIRVHAAAVAVARVSEAQLRLGVRLAWIAGTDPPAGVVAVTLERPGLFRLDPSSLGARWSATPGRSCQVGVGGAVVASGTTLWLCGDLPAAGARATVKASRILLGRGPEAGVNLRLEGGVLAACDLATPGGGPVVASAGAVDGQPGVRLVERGSPTAAEGMGAGMAVGPAAAVSVALAIHQPVAMVWRADGGGEPLETRLSQLTMPAPRNESVAWGTWSGQVEDVTARSAELPTGVKRLRLALGASTVAVLADGDTVRSVHFAGGEPFAETVVSEASRLVLLHLREGVDRFDVEIVAPSDSGSGRHLTTDHPFESIEVATGVLRLPVVVSGPAGQTVTLHVRGANHEPVFVASDGLVRRGADVDAGRGGTLLIPHAPGRLLAWLDRPGGLADALWGLVAAALAREVQPPAQIALSGKEVVLHVRLPGPGMLHVRGATPLATRLLRPQGPPEVEVHDGGCRLDAYLPSGEAELGLRAVAGGELSGTLTVTSSAITPIGEGLGPELLLAPGETRAFSFTLDHPGPVGVGVHASADVVECEVLDSSGARLGRGVVQMPTLEAGTYVLALRNPADAPPVRVRPALAGVTPPDTGPPAELVRCYLAIAAGKVSSCPEKGAEPARRPQPDEGTPESTDDGESQDQDGGGR